VMTVLTLLFLTGLFESLPEATLAAVVVAALIELVDFPALAALYRIASSRVSGVAARPDFIAAVAAMAGVLAFDTLPGLFIGIGVSLLLLLYRTSRPRMAVLGRVPGGSGQFADVANHPENEEVPGVRVVRVEGGLFFANADAVRAHLREQAHDVRALVLDAETVPFIDVSAARMLYETARDLEASGVRLLIARDIGQVRDVLHRTEDAPLRAFPTVREAVEAAREG
jgi:sulfate permease, SulP family